MAILAAATAVPALGESNVLRIDNGTLSVAYDTNMETFELFQGERRFASGARFNSGSEVAVRVIDVDDALGKGQAIEEKDVGGQTNWLVLYEGLPFVCVKIAFTNTWEDAISINELEPVALSMDLGAPPEQCRVLGCDELTPATEARTSYTFLAAANVSDRSGFVCGWLTHERGSGIVQSEVIDGKIQVVGDTTYGGKLNIPAAKTADGEILAIGYFDDALDGLEAYADAIAKANDIHLPPAPSGYCTWYHAGALDEGRMAELAAFCQAELRDFGFEFLQIDDRWQQSNRDFTTHKADGPYPSGMKATADAVTAAGLRAGLWLTPFGWDRNAPALADHQDWFVHREDGSVYAVEWGGDCLDMSHPDARAFLSDVIGRTTRAWGYRYLKIDGLWAGMAVTLLYPEPDYREDGLGDAVFHDAAKTNVEAYRDGLKLVREAAGDDVFLLGCNIAQNMRTLGASIGLLDGMRVGRDIGPNLDQILPCAQMGSRLYFLNGKVWHNDPDCLMLRPPLTLDQARAWGTWIAIAGQMNVVSEWLPGLPPERLDIVKRTMPNHGLRARPLDLFDNDLPAVWHLPVHRAGLEWHVIGLFNWSKQDAMDVSLDLARIGLAGVPCTGFDFWEDEFLADVSASLDLRIPPGSSKAIALHRRVDRPQLVGTSRHVTQGAVDLVSVEWDEGAAELRGVSRVVANDPYELRIAKAAPWRVTSAKASGTIEPLDLDQREKSARVIIQSDKTREVAWRLRFEK